LFQTTEPLGAATMTIDGSQTYQLIDGFGVNANHRNWTSNELQPVLDALIDQAGMTLFRVLYDRTDWEAVNDNSDPHVMNWSY
jgi:O-glycosyl hydrolase